MTQRLKSENFPKNGENIKFTFLYNINVFISDSIIGSIAVCAGSGSSVLEGSKADLWITGEMSHHEVLDAVHNGTSVILCDHSNTERGFLKVFASELSSILNNAVTVQVSDLDADPLQIVWIIEDIFIQNHFKFRLFALDLNIIFIFFIT